MCACVFRVRVGMCTAFDLILCHSGYGALGPRTLWGHAIVFLETFASVIVLAIVTGIPYIKFSKTHNKLKFTNPVVNMGEHGPQLQIRICIDTQQAQLFNAKFKLTLARTERSSMGTVRPSWL